MPDEYVVINGQRYKKPTGGICGYCGSDMLEFYDDGTGICLNCGRTFSWLKPLKEPIRPQARKTPPQPGTQRARAAAPVAAASVSSAPARAPAPVTQQPVQQPVTQSIQSMARKPVKKGVLSSRGISILGLLAAIFIGIGAIMLIAVLPMGSWPPDDFDSDTLGNIMKGALMVWATGTMLFLMAGFASAGTDDLDPNVRRTLIGASVALAILSFSLWMGMRLANGF